MNGKPLDVLFSLILILKSLSRLGSAKPSWVIWVCECVLLCFVFHKMFKACILACDLGATTLSLLCNLKNSPPQSCLPAMTLYAHTVNLGGGTMDYSSSWAVFPVTWWVDACQYPLKRFFWRLPLHSFFLARPHRLPSHRGWAQRRDRCPWCCLATAWWCQGAEPCTIHSSVSFLTFREAGLSDMHISYFSPAFLLCRSPLTKWLCAHLGLCPKCFHFCLFLQLG